MAFFSNMKKPKVLEKVVQNACIDILRIYGFKVHRINSGMITVKGKKRDRRIRLAEAGTSDLICCSPLGEFFAIEIKAPGNKPTELQRNYLKDIENLGGYAIWTDSADELEDFLKENGYKAWNN